MGRFASSPLVLVVLYSASSPSVLVVLYSFLLPFCRLLQKQFEKIYSVETVEALLKGKKRMVKGGTGAGKQSEVTGIFTILKETFLHALFTGQMPIIHKK